MKSVKVITRFSNEPARQSVVALEAALRDRLVRDVAAKLDTAFIASSATDGTEPRGLINYAGVQSMPTIGVPPRRPARRGGGEASTTIPRRSRRICGP
ncbi:MAG: phage major capsid protein [Actinomycetota bacterium]